MSQRRTQIAEHRTKTTALPSFCVPRSAFCASLPAFTLVELVAAMVIMSVLTLAIGSALSFSIKAANGQGVTDQKNMLAAGAAADQIADDLHVASSFSERTGTSVAFTVPPRVGGVPNQVRYSWDGTSGHSIYRQFMPAASPVLTGANATYPPVEFLTGVTNFKLNYLFRLMGAAAVADQLLASHDSTLLGSFSNQNIDSSHWISQYFQVSRPSGTSTYTITRILVPMKANGGNDGGMAVRLMTADGSGRPVTLIEQAVVYESAMSTAYEYVEVPFTQTVNRTDSGLCVVIGGYSGSGTAGTVQYESALLGILSGWTWTTSSNGTTWSGALLNTSCLRMIVYGTAQ